MPEILNSILAFIVAIALLVAIHEYGHYIVARAVGVKVLRFSIGFGRPLWMKRAGPDGTEYCISSIPLGGYVKLLDERDCAVTYAERDRAFNRKSIPARIAVLAAGPAFNLLFAILAYWAMFLGGVPGTRPVIGPVHDDTPAARAGLAADDEIVAVGDRPVATWEGATLAMLDEMLATGAVPLTVKRADGTSRSVRLDVAGRESELTEPGRLFEGLGFDQWRPRLDAVLGPLTAGGAAERAGLKTGDLVMAMDGKPVADWEDWVERVRASPGLEVQVTVRRGETQLRVPLSIDTVETEDGTAIGRIGAAVSWPAELMASMRAEERYGPREALVQATSRTWEMSVLTLRMIGRMVVGDVSVKNISGPINIAQYAGVSASIGAAAFLSFLAVVSISLGVLNLLPVPLLDGGQILYSVVEAVKGSPLSEKAQVIGQQVGILLLLVLMSFAFYNDLTRLFG